MYYILFTKTSHTKIRHLMDHSSGIPVWTISVIPEGSEGEITLEETVRRIADVKLAHAPGEVYEYATINYDVLALIIEEVTGKKYEDYITGTVLNNAGMDESFFRISDSDRQRIFPGRKAGFFDTRQYNAPTYYGNTTAGCHRIDHLRFFIILSHFIYAIHFYDKRRRWDCKG